jgi:hypothetical protein
MRSGRTCSGRPGPADVSKTSELSYTGVVLSFCLITIYDRDIKEYSRWLVQASTPQRHANGQVKTRSAVGFWVLRWIFLNTKYTKLQRPMAVLPLTL